MTIPAFYNGQVLQGPALTAALTATSADAQAAVAAGLATGSGSAGIGTQAAGAIYQSLTIWATNSDRDVVLKDGTGNLRLSADFTLTNAQDRIVVEYDGTNWAEISRSDNTA